MTDIIDQHRRALAAAVLELYRATHLAGQIRRYLTACAAARAAAPTTDHHQPALFALEPQP